MGSGSSSNLPNYRWQFVKRDDNYEIYQNQSGILAEKHIILNDPKLDQDQQLQSYYYRYSTKKPIVKVYKAQYQTKKDFCSNYKNIEVFTEYVPFRLADVKALSHEQGLYVFSQCLTGFQQLFNKLGAFAINQTLIGFNQYGQVRVWHSPNFAKNHFDVDGIILVSTLNPYDFDNRVIYTQQQEMVDNLWTAVARYSSFKPNFYDTIQRCPNLCFQTARELVNTEIGNSNYVPSRLRFEDKNSIIESSRHMQNSQGLSNSRNNYVQYR